MALSRRSRELNYIQVTGVSPGVEPVADLRAADASDTFPEIDATVRAALQGVNLSSLAAYGDVQGTKRLREQLAARARVRPHDVMVCNGASEALSIVLSLTVDMHSRVAIPAPGFPGYRQLVHLFGGRPVPYEVALSGAVARPFRPRLSALVVNQPHNPTGTCWEPEQLGEVLEQAFRLPCTPILDMSDTTLSNFSAFLQAVPEPALANGFLVGTLSKWFSVPDLRLGFLITTNPLYMDRARAVKTHLSMATSGLGQMIATALLSSTAALKIANSRSRRLSEAYLTIARSVPPPYRISKSGGGSYAMLSAGEGVLAEKGLLGLSGQLFQAPYESTRICLDQSEETIALASRILARWGP